MGNELNLAIATIKDLMTEMNELLEFAKIDKNIEHVKINAEISYLKAKKALLALQPHDEEE